MSSMLFAESTQAQSWLFPDATALAHVRSEAHQQAVRRVTAWHAGDHTDLIARCLPTSAVAASAGSSGSRKRPRDEAGELGVACLDPAEELAVVEFYCTKIQETVRLPAFERLHRDDKVEATAVTFFRRFYLSNSVMEFDPKVLVPTAVLLAMKCEGTMSGDDKINEFVPLKAANAGGIADVTAQAVPDILAMELHLLQGLAFQLYCFHPFVPLRGLVEKLGLGTPPAPVLFAGAPDAASEAEAAASAMAAQARLVEHGSAKLRLAMLTDLPLLHPPARLAMAALLLCADDRSQPGGDDLGFHLVGADELMALLRQHTEVDAPAEARIRDAADALRAHLTAPAPPPPKQQNKKLKGCAVWQKSKSKKKEAKQQRT